jgi:hypothetical protein
MTDRTATLSFSDASPSITFPVLEGTIGPDVIDIRTLYGKTGKFTYDPGFMSTAACNSTITYIDGDKGELCIAATRSRSSRPSAITSRCATSCCTATCPTPRRRRTSTAA